MDIATFTANVISSCAWPVCVVIVILLLRGPLSVLIPLLKQLQWKDLSLSFGGELSKAESLAEKAQFPSRPQDPSTDSVARGTSYDNRLAIDAPSAAIIQSWKRLEDFLADWLRPLEPVSASRGRLVEATVRRLKLSDDAVKLLRQLQEMRNQAAHGRSDGIGTKDAVVYDDLINRAIAAVRVEIARGN